MLGKLRSEREPRVFGRFTKPAALILGPRRERAFIAPSECLATCESVREARALPSESEHSELGVAGLEGEDVAGEWGE